MREVADVERIERFMRALGAAARTPVRVYLTGGVTAVLFGWRSATVDVDIKLIPESDEILRALPAIKEKLRVNVELAAPDQFIPALPGWQERSVFVRQERRVAFFHYDPYAQALSKIERGHLKDLLDVRSMLERGLIEKAELVRLFGGIEPQLYRYPAIDPPSFRKAVEGFTSR
jgi:hypothetical protein